MEEGLIRMLLKIWILLLLSVGCEAAYQVQPEITREYRESRLASREDLALKVLEEQTLTPSRLWREKGDLFQRALNTELDNTVVPEDKLVVTRDHESGRSYWRYVTRRYDTWYPYDTHLLGGEGQLCDVKRFKKDFAARLKTLEARLPVVELKLGGPAQQLSDCKHAFCLGCIRELQHRTDSVESPDGKIGWPCPTCRMPFNGYEPIVSSEISSDSKSDSDCAICTQPLDMPIPTTTQKSAKKSRH